MAGECFNCSHSGASNEFGCTSTEVEDYICDSCWEDFQAKKAKVDEAACCIEGCGEVANWGVIVKKRASGGIGNKETRMDKTIETELICGDDYYTRAD